MKNSNRLKSKPKKPNKKNGHILRKAGVIKRISKKEKVEKAVLDIALRVAHEGHGALFIIGDFKKNKDYVCMYPNLFEKVKLNILRKDVVPIIYKLATLDGAVIINADGKICAYGARVKHQKNIPGFGTRHAAARGASLVNALSIVVSEEHRIVRIFKGGAIVMEINPYTKSVEKELDKIIRILNSPETSAMVAGALGSAMLAGAVTATVVLPGVFVFTGGYIISRKIMNMLKSLKKR